MLKMPHQKKNLKKINNIVQSEKVRSRMSSDNPILDVQSDIQAHKKSNTYLRRTHANKRIHPECI